MQPLVAVASFGDFDQEDARARLADDDAFGEDVARFEDVQPRPDEACWGSGWRR
jgi:hypothetical protein